jgi:hypothetical protein
MRTVLRWVKRELRGSGDAKQLIKPLTAGASILTATASIDAADEHGIGFCGRVSPSLRPLPTHPAQIMCPPGSGKFTSPKATVLNGEIPAFLRVENTPLYTVYHPASSANASRTAVLIVPGIGAEQLAGYRSEVGLSRELARRGIASMRFHPRGQGDSGGDSADLTIETMAADVRAVASDLRGRTGAEHLVAVAIRLGSLMVARAVADGEALHALALWEPVENPADYFRSLLRGVLFSQVAQGERSRLTVEGMLETIERKGAVDVLGYELHRTLIASADRNLADALAGWTGPTLLVQVDPRRSLARPHADLAQVLGVRGVPIEVREVRSEVGWPFLQNPAWQSDELVSLTADWIHARA